MPSVFLISDPHFGHGNICNFLDHNGGKLRPFSNALEMDEAIVSNWNKVVSPKDKVYVLGDIAMGKKHIVTVGRCNGTKVLIKGNHDRERLNDYAPFFKDIRSCHVLSGLILSHIPIHPSSLERFGCNVHGHTHSRKVLKDNGEIDPRYFNICVEHTNYTPILLEDLRTKIIEQGGSVTLAPKRTS